jgi:ArsR family transcriptional regulator
MDGPKNVTELVGLVGANQASVSRHLQTLTDVGILDRKREGLHVIYTIADESVAELCDLVCGRIEAFLKKRMTDLHEALD